MSWLFLIFATGVLVVGAFGLYLLLLAWSVNHKPDGQKSLADHWEEESKLPCSPSITSTVKESLRVFEPGVYQFPELDGDGVFSLLDDNYGSIAIRTKEMCLEDQQPLFEVCGPSGLEVDEDEYPFESVDAEIAFYLDGAKKIRSILEEAGVEAPTMVVINGNNYDLHN